MFGRKPNPELGNSRPSRAVADAYNQALQEASEELETARTAAERIVIAAPIKKLEENSHTVAGQSGGVT